MAQVLSDRQRSIVLVAHGSRREASNAAIVKLTEAVRLRAADRFLSVQHGFLELASPSVGESIDQAVRRGARVVRLVPYLLAPGRHVAGDIPEIVTAKREQYRQVMFEVAPYIGAATGMADLILTLATTSDTHTAA